MPAKKREKLGPEDLSKTPNPAIPESRMPSRLLIPLLIEDI